ncbi:hypothetical protein FC64_GL000922 [Ligilactobacillus araffinosus DSM 20653]|uniref:Uncharacterized protein n=1 Tax=Ligilactobacillus araffinosus DSM 20653 TaxID=1423820 RepID=A0A0R1ZAH4_9LACO|nr:hypothetical protein FC64_GL000922 [Ligilactobacillus araffinosus DSM 20653]
MVWVIVALVGGYLLENIPFIRNHKSYRLADYTVNGSSNVHNGYFIYSFENRKSLK